jgi:hypothetical protein
LSRTSWRRRRDGGSAIAAQDVRLPTGVAEADGAGLVGEDGGLHAVATRSSGAGSLSRKPLAPARSAAKTYSSRSKVVRTTTRPVLGGTGNYAGARGTLTITQHGAHAAALASHLS